MGPWGWWSPRDINIIRKRPTCQLRRGKHVTQKYNANACASHNTDPFGATGHAARPYWPLWRCSSAHLYLYPHTTLLPSVGGGSGCTFTYIWLFSPFFYYFIFTPFSLYSSPFILLFVKRTLALFPLFFSKFVYFRSWKMWKKINVFSFLHYLFIGRCSCTNHWWLHHSPTYIFI